MAVTMTGDVRGRLRIAARRRRALGVARAGKHFLEFGFEHGLQEFTSLIAKASFDRVEPVVEKAAQSSRFPTAAGKASCYGLSWRDLRRRSNAGIACWTKLDYAAFIFQPLHVVGTIGGGWAATGFASVRRFCTIAASVNSHRAPRGPAGAAGRAAGC